MTIIFLQACLHTSFVWLLGYTSKAQNNISEDYNARSKIKMIILLLSLAIAEQTNNKNNAPSHGMLTFLTNIHKQVSFFRKHVVVFSEFLRLLDSLIEKEGKMVVAQHEADILQPSINININIPASHSVISFKWFLWALPGSWLCKISLFFTTP